MAQCEHIFFLDHNNGEVRCRKCGDFDDEMQLFNKAAAEREAKEIFEASQINFE